MDMLKREPTPDAFLKSKGLSSWPQNVAKGLEELEAELEKKEITQKGFYRRKLRLVEPFLNNAQLKEIDELQKTQKEGKVSDEEYIKLLEQLLVPASWPENVAMGLKELEAELKDGEITKKGFYKRKWSLVEPVLKNAQLKKIEELQKTHEDDEEEFFKLRDELLVYEGVGERTVYRNRWICAGGIIVLVLIALATAATCFLILKEEL